MSPLGTTRLKSTDVSRLQSTSGNRAVSRLISLQRSRSNSPAANASEASHRLQRHGDADLAKQIESARLLEEEELLQRTPATTTGGPNALIQRHLQPAPDQDYFLGRVTPEMSTGLIAAINGLKGEIKASIISWLTANVKPGLLQTNKLKELEALDWQINLQKLTFPARVDPSGNGMVTMYPLYPDHYKADQTINLPKLKTTMTHEAFHSLSAKHAGLQAEGVNQKGSYDEAFTDLFALQAFYLSNNEVESYISGYWSGAGNRRWTGDLAQIVEEATGLSREDMVTAYLSDPESALAKIRANETVIKSTWADLNAGGESVTSATGGDRATGDAELRGEVRKRRPGPPAPGVAGAPAGVAAPGDDGFEDYVRVPGEDSRDAAPAGTDPDKAKALEDHIDTLRAVNKMPWKTPPDKTAKEQAKAALFAKVQLILPFMQSPVELRESELKKELEKLTPKASGKVRYDLLHNAAKALGFRREGAKDFGLNVIVPPENATGATSVASLPQETLTETLRGSGLATLANVFPDLGADQTAGDFLDEAGGGGYEAKTFTVGIHPANDKKYEFYVHELGHVKQHQQGFTQYESEAGKGDAIRPLILDYHNVVANENPHTHLTKPSEPGRKIRVRYEATPVEQTEAEIAREGAGVTLSVEDAAKALSATEKEKLLLAQIMEITAQPNYRVTGDGGKNICGPYILQNLVNELLAKKK